MQHQELTRAQTEAALRTQLDDTQSRLNETLARIAQLEADLAERPAPPASVCALPERPKVNGNTQPPLQPTDPAQAETASFQTIVEDLRARLDRLQDARRMAESPFLARTRQANRQRRRHEQISAESDEDDLPPARRTRLDPVDDESDSGAVIPGLSAEASAAALKLMAMKNHPAHSLTVQEVSKLRLKNRTDGPTPSQKLDIGDADHYQHWEHSLNQRWTVNWAAYLTDAEKITYALGWLTGNLFTSLEEWWTDDTLPNEAYTDFLFEVQTMLGVQFQPTDAKRDLELTFQHKNEPISQYYARLRTLWRRAKTTPEDRLLKFRSSLSPAYSNALLGRKFDSDKDCYLALLDIENELKARSMERQRALPDQDKRSTIATSTKQPAFHNRENRKEPSFVRDDHIPSAAEKTHNASFGPVAQKPPGWMGFFWKPQSHPKRANTNAHRLLSAQGRCWGCRGSGHMSTDACCPFFDKNNSSPSGQASNKGGHTGNRSGKNISALRTDASAATVSAEATASAPAAQVITSDDE